MYHVEEIAKKQWAVVHSTSGTRVTCNDYHGALQCCFDLQLKYQRVYRLSDVEVRCAR